MIGLRYFSHDMFSHIPARPNALSVFAVVVSRDNQIMLGQRKNIGDWGNDYELAGGFVRIDEIQDIRHCAVKRFHDDYGLSWHHVHELQLW